MNPSKTHSHSLATLLVGVTLALPALGDYANDFSGKNDADFTRYSPLAGFGAGGVFAFPASGGYSISALASPAPGQLGPARAGAFLTGQTYGDFTISYQIQGFSTANSQFMGVFGRVSSPGLGTLTGYAMGLDTTTSQLFISRVQGEVSQGPIGPSAVSAALTLSATETYSLSFTAVGSSFTGSISDRTGTELARISGTDSTFTSGQVGFGIAAQTLAAGATAQATFGNLQVAAVPEASTWALAGLGFGLLGWNLRRRV